MTARTNGPAATDGGTTRTSRAGGGGGEPRQPNEHDESADSQAGQAAGGGTMGRLAHDDATSGRQDTDRGPVVDKVYNQKVRPGASKAAPPG